MDAAPHHDRRPENARHPRGQGGDRQRSAPALRESAENWYVIFWLLAVLSAIGVWVALGMATAGAVGIGAALATVIAWVPAIAFLNIIRKEL